MAFLSALLWFIDQAKGIFAAPCVRVGQQALFPDHPLIRIAVRSADGLGYCYRKPGAM